MWHKQVKPLKWLIEKFWPVPGWTEEELAALPDTLKQETGSKFDIPKISEIISQPKKPSKGVVYYTDNQLNILLLQMCQQQILKGIKEKHVVSVSLEPIAFGTNIVVHGKRGYLTMAYQILAGLEASTADVIFLCEHDVLYHPSHFDFIPEKKDVYYYNQNIWQLRVEDGHALYVDDLNKLSQLCAYRETLITHFRERIKMLEEKEVELDFDFHNDRIQSEERKTLFNKFVRQMGFEPGTHSRPERVDDLKAEARRSELPNIDLRHDGNLTPSRWKKEQYKNQRFTKGWKEAENVPGWEHLHFPL